MTNPTSNYGFVLPTATDLVTDLPADFEVALQGVDTRLKALQPGTTLGDLAYSSATANTNTRLGIGTTGQVLAVTAGVPAWATPSVSAVTLISQQTVVGSSVATMSFPTISGTYKNLRLVWQAISSSGSWGDVLVRFNADTGSNYDDQVLKATATTVAGAEHIGATSMQSGTVGNTISSSGQLIIPNYASTVLKKSMAIGSFACWGTTAGSVSTNWGGGNWRNTAAITQIDLITNGAGNWGIGSSFTLYGES